MDTKNLQEELKNLLIQAEMEAGTGFSITSGFRTPEENVEVGGVEGSAHLTGEAADIACVNSMRRMRIVKALILGGFKRIGIGKDHIHCDISKTRTQDVMWLE